MIIDVHTHIGAHKGFKAADQWAMWSEITASRLLEYMASEGMERSVLLPLESWEMASEGFPFTTDLALDAVSLAPERLTAFCNVDPRDDRAEERVRRYLDLGCRGFGEHKVKLRVDDSRSREVYRLCGRLELAVLLHIDSVWNPDMEAFERVVEEFSNTVFIAHGPGWWAEISGAVDKAEAYPGGRVEPGGRVDRILSDYDNVYGDISAHSGYNALSRDPEFSLGFLRRNCEKLLLGTDCIYHFDKESHLGLLRSLHLQDSVFQVICGGNAERLLSPC